MKMPRKTPEEVKKGLECCAKNKPYPCNECPYERTFEEEWSCKLHSDALAYIQQLDEEKKQLQKRICDQRRQLRLLHAMYEWALSRLQKANLNDRAHFQHWMWERGYNPETLELPEPPKDG